MNFGWERAYAAWYHYFRNNTVSIHSAQEKAGLQQKCIGQYHCARIAAYVAIQNVEVTNFFWPHGKQF